MAREQWQRLFKIRGEEWISARRIGDFLLIDHCGMGMDNDL